jgi:pyrimidine and pyridine-specific 5'-nucleotidase
MGLSHEEASELHHQYYSQYGLALRGLVRHHQIDPLDFDKKCDGSLPLESMIYPDPSLRSLLSSIDRTKVRIWTLTNAYKSVSRCLARSLMLILPKHAERVLRILQVQDLIDGVIYCDYADPEFSCKPEAEYYREVN